MKKNLREKLLRRISVKNFAIYYFLIILIKVILGIVFLNAVYVTRNYIINPDKFWDKTFKNDKLLNLQTYCGFTGMYLICNSIFLIINNFLITFQIYCGGLKRKLLYAIIVFIIFQIALFVYSVFTLVKFTNLIYLFIILCVFSSINLIISTIYFILVLRVILIENEDYMFSISEMKNDSKKQLENLQKIKLLENKTSLS